MGYPPSCKYLSNIDTVVADSLAPQTHIRGLRPIFSLPYRKSGCFPDISVSNNLYLRMCIPPPVCKLFPYVAVSLSHIPPNSLQNDGTQAQNISYAFPS